jgi:hypothetical protein
MHKLKLYRASASSPRHIPLTGHIGRVCMMARPEDGQHSLLCLSRPPELLCKMPKELYLKMVWRADAQDTI